MNTQPILQVEHLTKHYGSLTAVNDLSLAVLPGEVFALLGPNGAGKTTTISMICGLLAPDCGKVLLRGAALHGKDARRRVGLCPQEVIVWPKLTCMEQLQFVGQLYGLTAAAALSAGKQLLADLGLREKRDQLAAKLSGGMQRRLNLALALVHDPEVVVLDEPEAGLDPQSRVRVRDYIRSLARLKTVLLTTHNIDEAERLADRAAIIDHGSLLALDTPDALKARLGRGDVLEIGLPAEPGDPDLLLKTLLPVDSEISATLTPRGVTLRALDLATKLPKILAVLNDLGLAPTEVRLRPNTLEDVFIQLTGRSLRE